MAVSKRIRFEVLRRDGYTCRYCHTTELPLVVDHVMPAALGGPDDPSNLVAACKPCNDGKASTGPDAPLVADVQEEALHHAEMIRQAYAVVVDRMGKRDDYIDEFADSFANQPVPGGWRDSVGRWFEMGVPIELVVDAALIARRSDKPFKGHGRFSYLCGIVWKQVHAVTEAVELRSAVLGSFVTDADQAALDEQSWNSGYDAGLKRGQRIGANEWSTSDLHYRLLCNVTDAESYAALQLAYEDFADSNLPSVRVAKPTPHMLPKDSWAA